MKIKNPILKGFNPDPSITKKEDKYYIATSTFDWMPGVQIHESSDLVNWKLISHPIDDLKLLDMRGNLDSGGIWAPDLSYYDGKFWLVYSNVQVVNGSFKDVKNYLITAEDIRGPWSDPIFLNGIGFDASLFHDDDGKKYLVQMQWDHRPYNNPFMGIRCTEYDHKSKKLVKDNSKIIWKGTGIKLTEAPHLYKMFGYYYLFCAEGGTTYSHSETVSRSKEIFGDYEGQPEIFMTAFDSPYNDLQKCGHGSLVKTDNDEWYFAHLTARPWHHSYESAIDPRGWCTLGRETAIQKVYWDDDKWPHILGGKEGSVEVDAPKIFKDVINKNDELINKFDDFDDNKLDINFNTVRVLFEQIGKIEDSKLVLKGSGSLSNHQEHSLVARRWQNFKFKAETKMIYDPNSHQQLAGLSNYYNTTHWSMIALTYDEEVGKCIEVLETNRGNLECYLKNTIQVPDDTKEIYFRTTVDTQFYTYQYSLDGNEWIDTGIKLDAKVLSDDYVNQTYGGFFTGAFVGMVNIDYTGYNNEAKFEYFKYEEED
ncbi:glycoside hydrolase family 43 protein [uncultured Anaerococcus sp.]|uniref:glycoside hydrolase family 43 protein n=1 Tax=uncultured Anaerococcus sp. TaxID=293428 RepID=UPI00280AC878|nr:glycoside hydrolase family 43 protein [uncultured Anaerococcus sp.]MDU5150149.1 glycoside hydrolase family 43 protein [Anaerococcus prevotii]